MSDVQLLADEAEYFSFGDTVHHVEPPKVFARSMKMLAETDYEAMVTAKGAHFLEGLRELQKRHPEIGEVDGLGLALRAEICEADGFTPNKAFVDRMVDIGLRGELEHRGARIGLVFDVGGYHKNVITLAPSLHISSEESDLGLALLEQLLRLASAPDDTGRSAAS